jgi:hypothetical protein
MGETNYFCEELELGHLGFHHHETDFTEVGPDSSQLVPYFDDGLGFRKFRLARPKKRPKADEVRQSNGIQDHKCGEDCRDGTNGAPGSTPNFDEAHDDLLFVRNEGSRISVLTGEGKAKSRTDRAGLKTHFHN